METVIRYEFIQLEALISHRPDALVAAEAVFFSWKNDLYEEIARIKYSMTNEVFRFPIIEQQVQHYIQNHQRALIALIDKTEKIESGSSLPAATHALEQLLDFVERHFARYFNQEEIPPATYINRVGQDLATESQWIQNELSRLQADPLLVQGTLHPLTEISTASVSHSPITYQKISYAREIHKEILQVIRQHQPDSDINVTLREKMCYLNNNSLTAFTYYKYYITTILAGCDAITDKVEQLSLLYKTINQIPFRPGPAYHDASSSLHLQLSNYLNEEIAYLEKIRSLSSSPLFEGTDAFLRGFRFKIELSVAQLSCLIHILTEARLIKNTNLSEVLRFMARFIQTPRAENISYNSLRAKFYNVEEGTRQSVKTVLLSMVRQIEKK